MPIGFSISREAPAFDRLRTRQLIVELIINADRSGLQRPAALNSSFFIHRNTAALNELPRSASDRFRCQPKASHCKAGAVMPHAPMRARTWHCRTMRPCTEQSNGLVLLLQFRSWPGCIINIIGNDRLPRLAKIYEFILIGQQADA
jgi:hypothetical protein